MTKATPISKSITEAQTLRDHLIPLPTSRAEKESWCFNSPNLFRNIPLKHLESYENLSPNFEWTAKPNTLGHSERVMQLDENDNFTLIETVTSEGENSLLHGVINIHLRPGSTFTHLRIHTGTTASAALRRTNVTIDQGATYSQFTLNTGFGLLRNETQVQLHGNQAHAQLFTLNLLNQKQMSDTVQNIKFQAPNCTADVRCRSVVNDAAQAIFQGKFHVDQIAQKTDAYMAANGLMLNDKAKIQQKPELEIYADDVKCSHGATTGTLDQNQLFYLQARGLPPSQAQALLLQAYVEELTAHLPDTLQMRIKPFTQDWLKTQSSNMLAA